MRGDVWYIIYKIKRGGGSDVVHFKYFSSAR